MVPTLCFAGQFTVFPLHQETGKDQSIEYKHQTESKAYSKIGNRVGTKAKQVCEAKAGTNVLHGPGGRKYTEL